MTSTLDRHRERFQANPGDSRAFEALEEHYFLAGDWAQLTDLYQQRLRGRDLAARPAARAPVLFRLGQIWEERRGETDRAVECYRQALASDRRFRPALEQLRRIHGGRGQWDLALQIAEMEAALPMSDSERATLLAETGLLWLERLDDPEQARDHFARALEAAPEHATALRGWARALQACGQTELAATAWQRLADQLRGPERAPALVALARLMSGPLGRSEQALELYRCALGDDPRNPEAVEALAAHATVNQQWPLLADLMERRFELAADPARRVEIALEAAGIERDRLSNGAAARVWCARAAELAPDNPAVFESLAELERERADDAALLRALERVVALREGEAPVSTLLEVASLHSAAGDDERALVHLRSALERTPQDALVMEALSDTLTRVGRYAELAEVLRRRAALAETDAHTAAAVYVELGALQEQRLGDTRAARNAYERAFDALPSAQGAAAALERLYREHEDWGGLCAFLQRAGGSGPPAERPGYLCTLGDLLAERLARPDDAARAYEAALALDAGALGAHRGLQQLAAASADREALLRAFEREAEVTRDRMRLAHLVGELVPMLEASGRHEQALGWATRWLEAAPEEVDAYLECARLHEVQGHDTERVGVLEKLDPLLEGAEQAANRRRLAAHHARHGRLDAAILSCEAALEVEPRDAEALKSLVAHLEGAGRLDELARARRWLAELLPPRQRAQCLDALARLLEERLGDPGGAIEVLQQLARDEASPPDVEPRLEALLERTERWEELAAHLAEREGELSPASPEAAALGLRRAALLLERLGRLDAAAAAYRDVRASHPDSAEASAGLERALRRSGDALALVAFLAEEAQRAATPAARERASLERAVLLEERLEQPDEARQSYGELALAATDTEIAAEASRRLESLLERSGAWAALREHLETQPAEAEAEVSRHERLTRLCRDRLGDPEAAIAHLQAAAELAPERAELWRELAALLDAAGRHADLARALEAEIETGPDLDRELALRARTAALWAGPLADPARARAHYERVIELDPVHPAAAEYLIDHWERDGRYGAVVRLLEARLEAIEEAPPSAEPDAEARRIALRLRIAELCAGPLEDVDAGIAALEQLLAAIGPQPVVAEPLADLYQRAGYVEDYIDLCRRASRVCPDPGERASWLLRLGDAHRERGESREAAEAYGHALDRRPDDRAIQAALRDLYRELGEAEPLARLLEAELESPGGADELALRLELAGLLGDSLERPEQALEHLRRVLQLQPGHAEALDRALALADALEEREAAGAGNAREGSDSRKPGVEAPGPARRAQSLLELVDGALARPLSPSRRAGLLARRARSLARIPGRAEEAALAYRESLALDPGQPGARGQLRALLEGQQRWDAVLECLLEEACGAESGARAALFERAVEIATEHFADDAALPWLQRLRAERPLDASVPRRIAEVHCRSGRWEAVLRALDDELDIVGDPRQRRDLFVEKAYLLEARFHSGARAAAVLECARSEGPRDREVLRELDRLYREAGRGRERASVLEALLRECGSEEKVTLHCELAALYSGPLAEPGRAAAQLLSAVAATPVGSAMRTELLAALGEALRGACMSDAWARCAEEELRVLGPKAAVFFERRRELRVELAAVYETELGRPDAALHHLLALLDESLPTDDPSGAAGLDEVEGVVLRLLRAQRSWVELDRRLAARLGRHADDAEGWLELARLRDERLYALPGAAEAYRRTLELRPDCLPAIRGLRSVAERLGEWSEVVATLERELEHPDRDRVAERGALLRRFGDICWHRLGSTTRASRCYAAALETNPLDFESLRSLQQLLESMEDWRGALDLYESEIEVLGDDAPERRQALWIRVGELARDRTGELQRARRAYLRAADALPLDPRRRFELAELHERCDDRAAFTEVFTTWCDDPTASAMGTDHLRLAEALEQLDRDEEALARVERALVVDEDLVPAWDTLARLREARGEAEEAARALCRAAERVADDEAARRLLHAAELTAYDDAEGAAALLRTAAGRDPGAAAVHARLAGICAQLGRPDEVVGEARLALDLREPLEVETRVEVALLGGRAARERGRTEETSRFFSEALALAPDDPEALAGYGSVLAAQGDLEGARRVLELRLGQGDRYPDRALHLAIVGRALEASGDLDAALERYEEALRDDPHLDDAHGRLVSLHEGANRVDEGVRALERWGDASREPSERIERLLRAAAWELREGGREESAERHLREVLETSPRSANTWEALAGLLWEQGRGDEALEVATAGLEALGEGPPRVALALIRGRALERQGERRRAAEAFAQAAAADPRCGEAALSAARLLRGLGEWRAAAIALDEFAARNGDGAPSELAEVLHQLARLLAGPLEDVEGALERYRRAVALDPERSDVRAALGELLSHRPGAWRDALAQLRLLLERNPCDADALHMLLRVARNRDSADAVARTLSVLQALGIASPAEESTPATPLAIADPVQLADPVGEAVRQLAVWAAEEIAAALEASESPSAAESGDATTAFRAAALAAEGRLTAPALLPLPAEELADVLTIVASLCLEAEQVHGSGERVNALSQGIGRRTRKKLRRLLDGVSLDAVSALDFGAWRTEVRALAAAAAIDETGADLRTALLALLGDGLDPLPDDLAENADLTPFVSACPQARALVSLAVRNCLASL